MTAATCAWKERQHGLTHTLLVSQVTSQTAYLTKRYSPISHYGRPQCDACQYNILSLTCIVSPPALAGIGRHTTQSNSWT